MTIHSLFSRLGLGVAFLFAVVTTALSATLPIGFTESVIASGLASPVTMQFAPDGRLFVLEQAGRVRVVQNGALLPDPFHTIPADTVDANGERGLLGIAFHPNFPAEPWVYLYYTVRAAGGIGAHNRLIRVQADGNVSTGSPQTLIDFEELGSSVYHNGGAMAFGPDGKLYLSVGENFQGALAQQMTSTFGKMLRLNADGTIPTDNPFYGSTTGNFRAIWALGLRNANNFAFNPSGTAPVMVINDVGEQSWEEINPGTAGANYGWPETEGDFNPSTYPDFTRPLFSYFHSQGCAIVGGAFYPSTMTAFPAEYRNRYYVADYCSGWIGSIDPANPPPTTQSTRPTEFASGIDDPVDVRVGADGALYYLARGTSAIYRVQYGTGQSAPGITTHPANQTVAPGATATFTVAANGTPPLAYQWQRFTGGTWTNVGGNSPSYSLTNAQLSDDGARLRVVVSNGAGSVTSNEAVLTVTTNQPPVATITLPAAGATFGGGQTIAVAGTGTDPEDGTLPASAFTWEVVQHHDAHTHPFVPPFSGVQSGSFVVPTVWHAENTWYRIHLTVRDSDGQTHSVFRDVMPRVVQLTVTSNPPGRPLWIDSRPVTAPHTFGSVEGMVRTIEARNHAEGGVAYVFTGWSDGGTAQHDIVTPAAPATYTATFATVTAVPPTGFTLSANGATLTAAWNRVSGVSNYRLEVGSAPGLSNLLNLDLGDVAFIQGVVPVGTYYARVRAIYSSGPSAPSTEASAQVVTTAVCVSPPPVPTNFVARSGGLAAELTWAPAPAALGYRLEVGSAAGASNVLVANLGTTSFTATGGAGAYYTRVRALNACGASAPSEERAVVLGCTPDAVVPTNLTATAANGVATIAWQAPLGATGYRLLIGSAPGVANLLDVAVGTGTILQVPLGGVPPGTYYIRVAAASACGMGLPSNEVALTVP